MDKSIEQEIMDTTLICCAHHQRCPLFEQGMWRLSNLGFKHIWILDTGKEKWGEYKGPYELIKKVPNTNVFEGLIQLWEMGLPRGSNVIKRILLVDSDLIIFDPNDTMEYLKDFVIYNYDLATLSSHMFPRLRVDHRTIIETENMNDVLRQFNPGAIAYSIFSVDLWNKIGLEKRAFDPPSEAFWGRVNKHNPKHGFHVMDKATNHIPGIHTYSQFEKGKWIHIGNLTGSYFLIESGKEHLMSDFHRGYFYRYFPDDLPDCPDEDKEKYINLWFSFLGVKDTVYTEKYTTLIDAYESTTTFHPSDKGYVCGYIEKYQEYLQPKRDDPIILCELGVQHGSSLLLWDRFFSHPDTLIYGVDFNPLSQKIEIIETLSNRVHLIEKNYFYTKGSFIESSKFDFIIDDGDKSVITQSRALKSLWKTIKNGGVYIIEDVKEENIDFLTKDHPNAVILNNTNYKKEDGTRRYAIDSIAIIIQKQGE